MVSLERKWWALIAVCLGEFMLMLDITIITVALPSISRELRTSFDDVQWIVDAYALTLAALLLNAGALADLLGRRRVFAVGLVVFTGASLLCGAAVSPLFLVVARALQGVGGAIIFATALAILAQEFTGKDRGTALGIFGATLGSAIALGPLAGGLLTDVLGWRWIFFVNAPVGALALLITLRHVRETRDRLARGIDWAGMVTFAGALFTLLAGLIKGNDWGWGSTRVVAALALAAALLIAFLLIELRQERPMLDLTLFRKRAFLGASAGALAVSGSLFAMFVYLTLYFQGPLGFSPLEAGLRFLPTTTLSFIAAAIAGRLTSRLPLRVMLSVGLLVIAIGLWKMRGLTADSGWTTFLPGLVLTGIGFGVVNPSLAAAALGVVPTSRSGMASGINSTCRQVGIATGIASLGALFQHQITQHVTRTLAAVPTVAHRAPELAHALAAGGTQRVIAGAAPAQRPALAELARGAYATALNSVFLASAIIALVGSALTLWLVRSRDFVTPEREPPPTADLSASDAALTTTSTTADERASRDSVTVETAPSH